MTPEDELCRATARLRPWVLFPAWGSLLALLTLYPLFPAWFARYQFVPFLLGIVLLGLPHGAMDHLVMPHLERRRLTARGLTGFVFGYGALVTLYLAFWRVWPTGAFVVFLLLSWLHWGQGDAYCLETFAGRRRPRSGLSLALIWAVRGALPILLPPLAFPRVFQSVAQGILRWYAPGASAPPLSAHIQALGIGALLLLIALYLGIAWREDGRRGGPPLWTDAFEIGLLLLVFCRVPPVLAVGVYFCVWHSWRHIARLMLTDTVTRRDLANGRWQRTLGRTWGQSLPMTLGALALLGGLYFTQGRRAASEGDFVTLYLSLIAALTFPHFLLVIWMDRRQGLFRFRPQQRETVRAE